MHRDTRRQQGHGRVPASRRAGSGKGIAEREGGPPAGCRSGSTGAGRATRGQHERICRPLRFHVSRVILECSL